jgi:hypothetical protein
MPNEKQPLNEGYVPEREERGYQPQQQGPPPTGDPEPQSGYVPTGTGDNPTNTPTPPGDE